MASPETYQPQPTRRRGPPKPRLADPRNVESQLRPEDFIQPDYNPDIQRANPKLSTDLGHDAAIIRMMLARITSAINYKRVKEPAWYESLAYYLGTQNVRWNYGSRSLVPFRTEKTAKRTYAARNKIRPKVKGLTYQSFVRKPDAAVKPGTDSDLDRQATAEGRASLSHLDHKFSRDQQTRRVGHWSIITGLSALKLGWNETAAAEMPKFDALGNIIGSEIVDGVGEIFEKIVPIFELLMDPEAREPDDMQWIIHQHIYPTSYIRATWPNGKFVKADTGQGIAGYVESRLAAVLGEYMRGTEPGPIKQTTAVVYECFEPPTPDLYPDGRMIVCSRDVLLQEEEEWPNMDAKKLATMGIHVPYAFMNYEVCPGSLYPIGAVEDMIPPQQTINKAVSRQEQHLETAWGKLIIEEGSRVPVNAFDDAIPNEKITHARGSTPPQHLAPTFEIMEAAGKLKAEAEADLDDISGLHEVSEAQTPGNEEFSGKAIGKLKQSDAMQMSMFAANIEEYHRQRATLEIHILGRNYIEPRLLFISDGYFGDPAKKRKIPTGVPGGQNPAGSVPPIPQSLNPPATAPPPPPMAPPPPEMPGGAAAAVPASPPPPGPPMGNQSPMPGASPAAAAPMPPPGQSGGGTLASMAPGPPPLPPFVADTDTAAMEVKSFKALQNGGSCHIEIRPGSALATDPDAEKAEIMELFKAGLFGPPGDPITAGIVLDLLDYAGADEIVEAVRKAAMERIAFQMAMVPDAGGAAAQKAASDMALEQEKGQREVALEQAKQNHEGAILALKDQIDQEKQERTAQYEAGAAQAEQRFNLYTTLLSKLHPELRITAQATEVDTAAILQTMGFQTPDMPQLLKMSEANATAAAAGPLPTANAGGGGGGEQASSPTPQQQQATTPAPAAAAPALPQDTDTESTNGNV